MKNIFYTITIALLIYGAYVFLNNSSENKKWTLIVCSSLMADGGCYDNAFKVPGYTSYAACFSAGAPYASSGFECGRGCETKDIGIVCKEVCNASGCSE